MNQKFPPNSLKESAYALAAFFDVFDRPLRKEDFYRCCEGFSEDEIDGLLSGIEKGEDERLSFKDGYYFLKGRDGIVDVFEERCGINEKFWKKTRKYVPKLYNVPFIRSVSVCNTLSFDNCDEDSDIDLFIVVKDGRIFTARTLASLLFHLFGVRRHGQKIAGRFCLSFFATEDMFERIDEVAQKPVDPYFFYWKKFLSGFKRRQEFFVDMREKFFGGSLGDVLEKWLEKKHLQRYEMRKKELGPNADIVVSKNMLKFHNVDKRKEFNEKFFERYDKLL